MSRSFQNRNATCECTSHQGSWLVKSNRIVTELIESHISAEDRQGETALLPIEAVGTIPDSAVLARVTITQNRISGRAHDGYLDNIAIAPSSELLFFSAALKYNSATGRSCFFMATPGPRLARNLHANRLTRKPTSWCES